jgi:AcrR family transcriptional regulator
VTEPLAPRRLGGHGNRRGRPRDPSVDEAIILATLDLLDERGYVGLSLAEVANRAGVSRTALYRRWSHKSHLVVEAMVSRLPARGLPDTGSTRGDLLAYTQQLAATFSHTPAARVLPGLVAAIATDPSLATSYRELLVQPLRQQVRAAVTRGIARGELNEDTDVEFLLDALAGPLYVRLLITGDPPDSNYPSAAVDLVVARYGRQVSSTTPTIPAAPHRRKSRKDSS